MHVRCSDWTCYSSLLPFDRSLQSRKHLRWVEDTTMVGSRELWSPPGLDAPPPERWEVTTELYRSCSRLSPTLQTGQSFPRHFFQTNTLCYNWWGQATICHWCVTVCLPRLYSDCSRGDSEEDLSENYTFSPLLDTQIHYTETGVFGVFLYSACLNRCS